MGRADGSFLAYRKSNFLIFDVKQNTKHHEKNNRHNHDYNRWRNASPWWT